MNFKEALIMCGPAGVPCGESIINTETGRAKNNHWMISSNGTVLARGSAYTNDYNVDSLENYKNNTAQTPILSTVKDGVVIDLSITEKDIEDDWRVLSSGELLNIF